MANLTSGKRAKMPKSQFAGPGKSFPINDATHAPDVLRALVSCPTTSKTVIEIGATGVSEPSEISKIAVKRLAIR